MALSSIDKIAIVKTFAEAEFNPKETLQWVGLNKIKLFSWGFKSPIVFGNKALAFKVSGRHHKGIVLITLAWDDTYTVRLFSNQWVEKAKFEGIYCDMLNEFIDRKVEYIEAYKNN